MARPRRNANLWSCSGRGQFPETLAYLAELEGIYGFKTIIYYPDGCQSRPPTRPVLRCSFGAQPAAAAAAAAAVALPSVLVPFVRLSAAFSVGGRPR